MLAEVFESDELSEDDDDVAIIETRTKIVVPIQDQDDENTTDEDTQQPVLSHIDDDEKELFDEFAQIDSPSVPVHSLSVPDLHLSVEPPSIPVENIEDDAIRAGYYWVSHSRFDFQSNNVKIKILGHTETFEKQKVLFLIKTYGYDTACWEQVTTITKHFPEIVTQYEESDVQYLYIACDEKKHSLNIFLDGSYDTTITNPLTQSIGKQNIPKSDVDVLLDKKKRMMELQDELRILNQEIFDIVLPVAKKIKV